MAYLRTTLCWDFRPRINESIPGLVRDEGITLRVGQGGWVGGYGTVQTGLAMDCGGCGLGVGIQRGRGHTHQANKHLANHSVTMYIL